MNTSLIDDNTKINVKLYILDPLSVIIKLAILNSKPVGTKLLILNNVIYFQEPGPFQSICRMFYNSNKRDLQYIYNPINIACLHFLSNTFHEKMPQIKTLFICASNGLKKLMETYKSCSILNLTLNYYYVLLTNYLDQNSKGENIFNKDGFSCYYTKEICDILNTQWCDEKIKVILDIILFLSKYNENQNNVKTLETIMDGIDANTQKTIMEYL